MFAYECYFLFRHSHGSTGCGLVHDGKVVARSLVNVS
jgi:hypothetical protein